jgi:hypothetical protein
MLFVHVTAGCTVSMYINTNTFVFNAEEEKYLWNKIKKIFTEFVFHPIRFRS